MASVARAADLGDMRAYLQKIQSYSLLSPEEESALARAWRDSRAQDAAHKLVTSHLRLVVKIATGYRGYGFPLGELVSEGNIGMIRALQGFDPDLGFRLATYAIWWIRASIQQYILSSWSLVKVGTTASQKKLIFNLRRLKSQMRIADDAGLRSAHAALIADVLKVPKHDVIVMDSRLSAADCSLNAPLFRDERDEWQDLVADESDTQESLLADHEELTMRRALFHDAFKVLSTRERHILIERRLKDQAVKLDELARHYNVSRERIRQIEIRAGGITEGLPSASSEVPASASSVVRTFTTVMLTIAGKALATTSGTLQVLGAAAMAGAHVPMMPSAANPTMVAGMRFVRLRCGMDKTLADLECMLPHDVRTLFAL